MTTPRILVASLAAIVLMTSCQDEAIENNVSSTTDLTPQGTIIVDGEPMYAGYGYDPVRDRAFRNAIDPWSTFESTDIREALAVEVTTIETKEEIEKFVGRNFSLDVNIGIDIFQIGLEISNDIEKKTTIDANHVTVIARIKSRTGKYLCDAYPFLTTRAEQTINRGSAKRFIGNYGLLYVDTRIVGGEVYYVYTYDYRRISQWNKSEFKAKVTAQITERFGLTAGGGVTSTDSQLISNAQKTASITSTIPGFSPRIITDLEQVNEEIAGIQNYLNSNPQKATTIEMVLTPFHNFIKEDYPSFGSDLENEYTKYLSNLQGN
ncbi:MAC/perforin domain-containing protein [Tenacibaculum amylolyticum]|uniref:MAC/perforin domain-containing protein n=1 Tax=Tenacibaculum amylolyticum TaxID=104269 RepID=UPI0038956DB3